jgi:type IV pilus assembly protein PilB
MKTKAMDTSLATTLYHAGDINAKQEQAVQAYAEKNQCSIPDALTALAFVSPALLLRRLTALFKIEVVTLSQYDYPSLCRLFNLKELILTHTALPIRKENQRLTLAIADPTNRAIEPEFAFATGLEIELALADCKQISSAIRQLYGTVSPNTRYHPQEINQEQLAELIDISSDELDERQLEQDLDQDDAPVSRFIHQVLVDAVHKHASDIHFEPYEHSYRIRLRCDGLLVEVQQPAARLAPRLAARLKILAKLDIAERRRPQDGRIKLKLNTDTAIDIRVSTLPTLWGEKIVLRLLDNQTTILQLDSLGYSHAQKAHYLRALQRPQGMILFTGPTGSGKTVSLYAGLTLLNHVERNISTAEDPVEINLSGINQVQINPAIKFGFSEAIRVFLRQDPDVIMLGEIRDTETAQVAMRAAQTGHLVLSTLHTNSAAESIVRLVNMGVARFNITAALSLVVAQRLARRLCPHCKQGHLLTESEAGIFDIQRPTSVYAANPSGCSECVNGYAGRIGIYEVMPINAEIISVISNNGSIAEIESTAQNNGMATLKASGLEKLLAGLTSFKELERVLYFS